MQGKPRAHPRRLRSIFFSKNKPFQHVPRKEQKRGKRRAQCKRRPSKEGSGCRATTARGKSPPPSSADRRTSAMPLLASAELTTDLPRRRDDAALLQSRESPDDRPPAPRAFLEPDIASRQASPFSFVAALLISFVCCSQMTTKSLRLSTQFI